MVQIPNDFLKTTTDQHNTHTGTHLERLLPNEKKYLRRIQEERNEMKKNG